VPFIVFGKIVCTGLSAKWRKSPTIAFIDATFNCGCSPVFVPVLVTFYFRGGADQ
jgi:hypothetical protein